MLYPWLSPLLAAVVTLVLAVLVNRRGPRTQLSDVFCFLAATVVCWNLNFFVLYSVSDHDLAFSLSRVFRSGVMFMFPAILHLCVALIDKDSRFWRNTLAVDYSLAALLALANASDSLISEVRKVPWGYASVGTPIYNVFVALAVVNCSAAVGVLAYAYRTSADPRTRQQLKFWLFGALVALPLGQTNLLPAYGIAVYPLGHLGNAVWVGIVAYAIVRHRLMDIDLVVTKSMAYAVVSFILIAPAFALTLWLQRLSFGHIHPDFSFAVLAMLVSVGVLFPTLHLRAESRIQRSLFRQKHEYRAALVAFTRSIVRFLDTDRLVRELAITLGDTLQVDRIAVVLLDEARRMFASRYALGVSPAIDQIPLEHDFIASLTRRQEAVLREEIEADAVPSERQVVTEICQSNGWEVCIPLTAGSKLIGFIGLGSKRNVDAFFVEDLELLGTLAAETSVALENARLYEELKKSQDIIRRADRLSALGTLAAGIAHEVRNPLVSIQTFFQLAPDRLHDEEFFTTFLGMTAKEVKRIADLITELLSFARSPTRSLGPVNLNESVERVATLLEPEARKHHLKLERELAHPAPIVLADADQLKQVVINLVLNAIQATRPGGVVAVTTRSIKRGQTAAGEFEVKDTGTGMPQEQIDHIFDPFFTTKDMGTGLGLAIVHQIVMEHGGSISVESKEAYGTTFSVQLPMAVDAAAVGHSDASEAEAAGRRTALRQAAEGSGIVATSVALEGFEAGWIPMATQASRGRQASAFGRLSLSEGSPGRPTYSATSVGCTAIAVPGRGASRGSGFRIAGLGSRVRPDCSAR